MPIFDPTTIIAGSSLIGLITVTLAGIYGWRGWLALKQRELDNSRLLPGDEIGGYSSVSGARIEIADLKERIRKLEAIANGVDL